MTVILERFDVADRPFDPSSDDFKDAVELQASYLDQATQRLANEPTNPSYIEAVETLAVESSEIARQVPDVVDTVIKPLTSAARVLTEMIPGDFQSVRTVAEVAGNLHQAVGDQSEILAVAKDAIDTYYGDLAPTMPTEGVVDDTAEELYELAAEITESEAEAMRQAISQTDQETPFSEAYSDTVGDAMSSVETDYSAEQQFKSLRLAEQAARRAAYARRQKENGFELAHTGELYLDDGPDTEPLDVRAILSEEEQNPAPDHRDTKAWEEWKRGLRVNMTTKKAIRVAQFNYYDRLPLKDEIKQLVEAAREAAA